MVINKSKKSFLAVFFVLVMCLTFFSFSVSAASYDEKGTITLNVIYDEKENSVTDVVFRLYRFADVFLSDDNITYSYTAEFANCRMEMGNLTDAYLPVHLANYAKEQGLTYEEKSADENGNIVFSDLSLGAYLVVAGELNSDFLKSSPFIVSMPMAMTLENENAWSYDIVATPKVEIKSNQEEEIEKTYISVKKQWQGSNNHPSQISVTLLKDGDKAETVVLSNANNWHYKWDNLDKQHAWSVVESAVPDGYTVSYEASQMTVIITNTATFSEETTLPGGTTKPSSTEESTTEPEKLVQTGQLNWPVPVFAIAGLLLFSAGWAMLNLCKKKEDRV